MKMYLFLLLNTFLSICLINNDEYQKKVDNLKCIKEMPYLPELSGDSLYWSVVQEGISIIPYLIEKLSDSTNTTAIVPYFGGTYTVADIAYIAITEIIHGIPTLELAEDSTMLEYRNGYWGYWNYVRKKQENRLKFKSRIEEWFYKNKDNLQWVEYKQKFRNADDWKFEKGKHPLGGFYEFKHPPVNRSL